MEYLASGATSFPQAVAMGATWDPDLVHQVGTVISDEARALNVTDRERINILESYNKYCT